MKWLLDLIFRCLSTKEPSSLPPLLTLNQLCQVMPHLPRDKAVLYLAPLIQACEKFQVTAPHRLAAFLANIAEESGELHFWRELGGEHQRYAPYFCRGPMQLTWERNYKACGDALGLDLVTNPDLLLNSGPGFLSACWFWRTNGLNELADRGDFIGIVKKINGGTSGVQVRQKYWNTAKAVLNGS